MLTVVVDRTFTSGGVDFAHTLTHSSSPQKFYFRVLNFRGWSRPRNYFNSEIFPIYGSTCYSCMRTSKPWILQVVCPLLQFSQDILLCLSFQWRDGLLPHWSGGLERRRKGENGKGQLEKGGDRKPEKEE